MAKFVSRAKCLLCNSAQLVEVRREHNHLQNDAYMDSFLERESVLVKCQKCDFAFVRDLPAEPEFFAKLYRDEDRDISVDFKFSGKRIIFEEVMASLLKWAKPNSKLLDIGAGTGAFVNRAMRSYQAFGIELSTACVEFAKSQNLPIRNQSFFELKDEASSYDVITMIDVLEHLSEPAVALKTIHSLLKHNGILYIKVPNYPAQASKQDLMKLLRLSTAGIMQDFVHINHFTVSSLIQFLNTNGFTVKESGFSAAEIWDLTWTEAPKSKTTRRFYNWTVTSITSALNILSRLTKRNLGLNFYVVAERL